MPEVVVLGESGRLVLPAVIRRQFGLETGERLTVFSQDGEIRIVSRKMALEKIRAGIIKQRGSPEGILDEFLRERHEVQVEE